MRVVEKYYTQPELALLLSVSEKTIDRRRRSGEFGAGVINIGEDGKAADYRIPASGVNAYLERRRVFCESNPEPGIAARSEGKLRRKAKV